MRSRHFVVRFSPSIALALTLACASTPVPPTNVPTQPRSDTTAVIPQQPSGAPVATTFAYRDGTHSYDLQQTTIVTVGGGSAGNIEDTVVTTGSLTYTLRNLGDTLVVMGVIDSLSVTSARDTSALARRLLAPVTVELGAGRDTSISLPVDSTKAPASCDSMEDAARAIARDIHIRLPVGLQRGQRWTDSTTTPVCRGGIRMAATTVSSFEVQDIQVRGDSTLVGVMRRSTLTLAGTGVQGSRRIAVAGSGTSEALFRYDLRAGAFVESTGQSVLELRFETIQQTEQVTQRSTSRVRRRPGPP